MNIPRQPFLGLALMAALGIGVAGFFPIAASQWWLSAIIFAVLAIPLLCWPNFTSTYLLVGFVTSEPKVAPNGFATFLFKLESIEFDGKNDDGEAFPEMGDGAHHSAFAFLCGGHRTARFQHSRRGYELDSAWRFFLRTKSLALNSLAAATFFLLCWDTNEFFSTGFQLSFAVVGGIILLADPLSGWLRLIGAPDS